MSEKTVTNCIHVCHLNNRSLYHFVAKLARTGREVSYAVMSHTLPPMKVKYQMKFLPKYFIRSAYSNSLYATVGECRVPSDGISKDKLHYTNEQTVE